MSSGSRLTKAFIYSHSLSLSASAGRYIRHEGLRRKLFTEEPSAIYVMLTVRRMLCLVSCASSLYFYKTAAYVQPFHAVSELYKDRPMVLTSCRVTLIRIRNAQALPGLQPHGSCIGVGCLVKSLHKIVAL